jgi:hypothetical protein
MRHSGIRPQASARTHGERRRSRCTTEKFDELAPSHVP